MVRLQAEGEIVSFINGDSFQSQYGSITRINSDLRYAGFLNFNPNMVRLQVACLCKLEEPCHAFQSQYGSITRKLMAQRPSRPYHFNPNMVRLQVFINN